MRIVVVVIVLLSSFSTGAVWSQDATGPYTVAKSWGNQPIAVADVAAPTLPLSPQPDGDRENNANRSSGIQSFLRVGGSLALVLGLFLLLAWIFRRTSPHMIGSLPAEAVEVLGRSTLFGRQQICLIRCGGKLLLVGINTAGLQALSEITDPREIERLTGLCRAGRTENVQQKLNPAENRHV